MNEMDRSEKWKNYRILLNEWFTEQTILLNIVLWENEWNKWKMNDNFENRRNKIFWTIEKKLKKTKWVDERAKWKKCTRPSPLSRTSYLNLIGQNETWIVMFSKKPRYWQPDPNSVFHT